MNLEPGGVYINGRLVGHIKKAEFDLENMRLLWPPEMLTVAEQANQWRPTATNETAKDEALQAE